jgi:GDP-D-mannose dehydratase
MNFTTSLPKVMSMYVISYLDHVVDFIQFSGKLPEKLIVQTSFELPIYTAQVDAVGTLNALEAVRQSGLAGKTRFYQVRAIPLLFFIYLF